MKTRSLITVVLSIFLAACSAGNVTYEVPVAEAAPPLPPAVLNTPAPSTDGVTHSLACPNGGPIVGTTYYLSGELGIPAFFDTGGVGYLPNGNATYLGMVTHHVVREFTITTEMFPQVSMNDKTIVLANTNSPVTCTAAQ